MEAQKKHDECQERELKDQNSIWNNVTKLAADRQKMVSGGCLMCHLGTKRSKFNNYMSMFLLSSNGL